MALLDAVKMETRKGSIWWDSHHPCAKARPECQSLPALGAHPKTHLSSSTQGRVNGLCRAWLPECRLAVGRKNNSEYAKKGRFQPSHQTCQKKEPHPGRDGFCADVRPPARSCRGPARMWLEEHFQLHRASSKLLQESPLIFKTLLF